MLLFSTYFQLYMQLQINKTKAGQSSASAAVGATNAAAASSGSIAAATPTTFTSVASAASAAATAAAAAAAGCVVVSQNIRGKYLTFRSSIGIFMSKIRLSL